MKRRQVLTAGLLALATLPGCAGYYYGEKYGPTLGSALRGDLVDASYRATDALLQTVALDPSHPVLVATLVNVDRLAESSRLGRAVAEQIAGRLVQRGIRVTEPKLRETLAMRPDQGELLLSRELRDVSQAHDAQAVVVGTYAVSARQVYISLKLVHPQGNLVVAAHDYALPLDDDVRALLMAR
jgi:TolB-like protein